MPITWKNVGQTMSSGTAAHMFNGAVNNVTGGLDRIRGAISQVQEGREKEHEFNVDKNTSAYFDALQQYQTPEELAAARESGALARLRQSFDGVVDEDRIRGAADAREKTLRTNFLAGEQYQDQVALNKVEPLVERFRAGLADGKDMSDFLTENEQDLTAANLFGSLSQENTQYLRDEETRAANDQVRQIELENNIHIRDQRLASNAGLGFVHDAVGNFEDSGEAREALMQQIEKYNADSNTPGEINPGPLLTSLEAMHRSRWQLTSTQEEEVVSYAAELTRQAQPEIAREQEAIQTAESRLTDLQRFPWNNNERVSFGDAENALIYGNPELGVPEVVTTDKQELDFIRENLNRKLAVFNQKTVDRDISTSRGTRSETIENDQYDPTGRFPSLAEKHKGDILLEVARRLHGGHGMLQRIDGIDVVQYDSEILDVMDDVIAEFQSSVVENENLSRAISESRRNIETIQQRVTEGTRAYTDTLGITNKLPVRARRFRQENPNANLLDIGRAAILQGN